MKLLITGGTGLIGIPLVKMLIEWGAKIRIASLDDPYRAHPKAEFKQVNLTRFENCMEVCEGMDFIFHLAGIKGSPAMTIKKPVSFFVPTISFNTNMMEASRQCGVERYLCTSTIYVYSPAEVFTRMMFGKHSHQKMTNLRAGLSGWVSFRQKSIRLNMVGTRSPLSDQQLFMSPITILIQIMPW